MPSWCSVALTVLYFQASSKVHLAVAIWEFMFCTAPGEGLSFSAWVEDLPSIFGNLRNADKDNVLQKMKFTLEKLKTYAERVDKFKRNKDLIAMAKSEKQISLVQSEALAKIWAVLKDKAEDAMLVKQEFLVQQCGDQASFLPEPEGRWEFIEQCADHPLPQGEVDALKGMSTLLGFEEDFKGLQSKHAFNLLLNASALVLRVAWLQGTWAKVQFLIVAVQCLCLSVQVLRDFVQD